MAKRDSKKTRKETQQAPSVSVSVPEGLTQEEMTTIISEAILRAEQVRKTNEEQAAKEEAIVWREAAGLKDFETLKQPWRAIRTLLNRIASFFRILFGRKGSRQGDRVTTGLFTILTSTMFRIGCVLLWIVGIVFIGCVIGSFFADVPSLTSASQKALTVVLGALAIIFGQLFWKAGSEIEKMDDRNYVVAIFTALMSATAVIITLLLR